MLSVNLLQDAPMELPAPPDYLANALEAECRIAGMTLSQHPIGDLLLPTGKLVACDPVAYPETAPFSLLLPKGHFAVVLGVADTRDDQRVALATIQFGKEAPVRWAALAAHNSEENEDSLGFGVDSGVAGFMDHSAVGAMRAKEQEDEQAFYEAMDAEMKKKEVPTWSWLNVPFGSGNLVAFSPGYGDGDYLTYAGFGSSGAVTVVVTDFSIFQSDEKAG